MQTSEPAGLLLVDCRIGSLEINSRYLLPHATVDCRIGSLENVRLYFPLNVRVDCRIGSLETLKEVLL